MAWLGNKSTSIQYVLYDICPEPVFWCEFNGGVHFLIRLTIFGNFFVLYVCICVIHRFLVRIQSWRWLCHLETIFWWYMIWSSPNIIFWWEFSHDGDYVIWRLYFDNIWYGHHLASFFSENSVVMVTVSSRDHILIIYDMVITKHHFLVRTQSWWWFYHLETIFW